MIKQKMENIEIKNGVCIIPEGVKTIGYMAFMDCLDLKKSSLSRFFGKN